MQKLGKWYFSFILEGSCKFGNQCTFAHGETELRTKIENSLITQNSPMTNTMSNNPYDNIDYNEMLKMQMLQQQMMMMDPNFAKQMQMMGMVNPNNMQGYDFSNFNTPVNNNPYEGTLNMNNMYNYQNF